MKKNMHLVPVNVQDLGDKLKTPNLKDSEMTNYIMRLEAIRDFCDQAIKVDRDKRHKDYAQGWKSTRDFCS